MSLPIGESEARAALSAIAQRRQQVIAEIDVPSWYWCAMAAGWVALGVVADYAPPWAYLAATLLFGAAHASISPRVLTGRRASSRLHVRHEIGGPTDTRSDHWPSVGHGRGDGRRCTAFACRWRTAPGNLGQCRSGCAASDGGPKPHELGSPSLAAQPQLNGRTSFRRDHSSEYEVVDRGSPGLDRLGGVFLCPRPPWPLRFSTLEAVHHSRRRWLHRHRTDPVQSPPARSGGVD